jgi:hypothetical protein
MAPGDEPRRHLRQGPASGLAAFGRGKWTRRNPSTPGSGTSRPCSRKHRNHERDARDPENKQKGNQGDGHCVSPYKPFSVLYRTDSLFSGVRIAHMPQPPSFFSLEAEIQRKKLG